MRHRIRSPERSIVTAEAPLLRGMFISRVNRITACYISHMRTL